MAIMVPERPREFDPASQEGVMFEALSKLSDEYYVFHSFRITTITNNILHENEIDFVIFNRSKGVLCLEAKAGQITYENGVWIYGNGIPMRHGGPFNQASANKYKLMKYIENTLLSQILERCKFVHAVWFPSITMTKLSTISLPSEADKRIILTKEALTDPEKYLDSVFAIELPSKVQTNITDVEMQQLIKQIFCPRFNVFPSASFDADLKKMVFHRLLDQQAGILNYLEEQKTAAINGIAGTGKTMIAVEKAKRHAADGESVLFLCYNSKLKDFLEENYSDTRISYYTIAGYVCGLCNSTFPDYRKAKEVLENIYISGQFPYRNIVIDEGQDFGIDEIEEANIINTLLDIITDEGIDGTFYVFYDRLQLIQADRMPRFISDLDCRLTLYKNCRNTENIALNSLRPISDRKPKKLEVAVKGGVPAKIHYCNDYKEQKQRIDMVLNALSADGLKNIVLIIVNEFNN